VPGGVLALPSNDGRRNYQSFSIVPEVGLNLGLLLTSRLKAPVGYNFLYWTEVVRPGDQIDRVVDRNTIPTVQQFVLGALGTSPAPIREQTDFWMHGITFGLVLSF